MFKKFKRLLKRNNRAIIIPTYEGHFQYVVNFLISCKNNFLDIDTFDICFILSNIKEEKQLRKYLKHYSSSYNFKFNNIETILKSYGIKEDTSTLLKDLGKFSYQTIKKLYGVYYFQYDQSFVMDSESMCLSPFYMNKIFDDYFKNPYVLYFNFAFFKNKNLSDGLNYKTTQNIARLMNKKSIQNFYFDGFHWFYEKNIINDLFKSMGHNLLGIIKNFTKMQKTEYDKAIFECCLYYAFIKDNNTKYNYQFIDTLILLKNKLSNDNLVKIQKAFLEQGLTCPILMHGWEMLSIEETMNISKIYIDLKLPIARLFGTPQPIEKIKTFISGGNICLGVSTDGIQNLELYKSME